MAIDEVKLTLAVLRVIGSHTKDNPITGEAVGEMFGITQRKVAEIVREARLQGHKIGSSKSRPCGYFMARDASELEGVILHLKNEATNILLAVSRLQDWTTTQPTIWEAEA
jgi:biotin operon repressor